MEMENGRIQLGRFGIWWSGSWRSETTPLAAVAYEMERLGYRSFWLSGGFDAGLHRRFRELIDATERVVVASGILSVWPNEPTSVGEEVAGLGDRFLLGIGASHAPVVEAKGGHYERPLEKVSEFLDGLDSAPVPVPAGRRILAALGRKMLRLAGERSIGAHPYFVPVEHTIYAREVLGAGPLLAPEVAVVLESDAGRAREIARKYAATYLPLPNYAGNLRRLGYKEEDVALPGSNRVIDAVIPWGGLEKVAARLTEHLEAGADHICIQVLTGEARFPLEQYRLLAQALITPTK